MKIKTDFKIELEIFPDEKLWKDADDESKKLFINPSNSKEISTGIKIKQNPARIGHFSPVSVTRRV